MIINKIKFIIQYDITFLFWICMEIKSSCWDRNSRLALWLYICTINNIDITNLYETAIKRTVFCEYHRESLLISDPDIKVVLYHWTLIEKEANTNKTFVKKRSKRDRWKEVNRRQSAKVFIGYLPIDHKKKLFIIKWAICPLLEISK